MSEPTQLELDLTPTAPRVAYDDIEQEIASEYYFTAADAIAHANSIVKHKNPFRANRLPKTTTFCILQLKNGYTVTGESACVSEENYRPMLGRDLARQDAIKKMWPLLGFRLRDKLAAGGTNV